MKVTRSVRRPAFTVGQLVSLVLVGLLLPLVNIEAATATSSNEPSNETPAHHAVLRHSHNSNPGRGLNAKRHTVKICRSLNGQIYDQCVAFCRTHHCVNRRHKAYNKSCQRLFDAYLATAGEFPPCTDIGGVFHATWPATHFLNLTERDLAYNLSVSVKCDDITSPAVRTVVQSFIDQSPFPSLTCDELGVLAVYGPRDFRDMAGLGSVWCTSAMFYSEVLRFCENQRRRMTFYIAPPRGDLFSAEYELDWANELIKSMIDKGIVKMGAVDHQKFRTFWLAPGKVTLDKIPADDPYPGRDCSGQPYPECGAICCALQFYAGVPAEFWPPTITTAAWAVFPCEECAARVKERGPCPPSPPPPTNPPTLKPTVKPAKPTPCKAANGHKGTCLGSMPCLAKGGVPFSNPSCDNLHCCIDGDAFPPNACVSDETFIGECKSRSDCVAKHKTPLKGFATPGHECGGATAFCCVSPPVCESMTEGYPRSRITGTCIDKSGCKKQLVSRPGPPWMCPGDNDIQCCMDLPGCSVNGVHGQCMDKTLCVGPSLVIHDNLCPGDDEIKCCVALPVAPTGSPTTSPPTEPPTEPFNPKVHLIYGLAGERYGFSVALSADGIVMASGSGKFGEPRQAGFVRAFSYDAQSNVWSSLGQEFRGTADASWGGEELGASVALSGDGLIMAAGAPMHSETGSFVGCIKVLQYSDVGDAWGLVGDVIYGLGTNNYFGGVVAISDDGNTVAGGQVAFNEAFLTQSHARVFTLNPTTQVWDQLGQVLYGKATADYFGSPLALARDGRTLAVGGVASPRTSRYYQVYRYDDTNQRWSQLGQDISGVNVGNDNYPQHGVSLSASGTIVAFGDFRTEYDDVSHQTHLILFVQVFEFRQNTQTWIQLGKDIVAEVQDIATTGYFVPTVGLSSDGQILATGSEHEVRLFRFDSTTNDWIVAYTRVASAGRDSDQSSAINVDMSSDGTYVAGGMPWADDQEEGAVLVLVT